METSVRLQKDCSYWRSICILKLQWQRHQGIHAIRNVRKNYSFQNGHIVLEDRLMSFEFWIVRKIDRGSINPDKLDSLRSKMMNQLRRQRHEIRVPFLWI